MRFTLPLLTLAALAIGCRRDKGECPGGLTCTMEFRLITVEVRDSTGAAVVLDSIRTVRDSDGRVYRFEPLAVPPESHYVVLTDAEMNEVGTRGVAFSFQGFLAGTAVATAGYLIRHDCCHVEKVSGPAVITLSP